MVQNDDYLGSKRLCEHRRRNRHRLFAPVCGASRIAYLRPRVLVLRAGQRDSIRNIVSTSEVPGRVIECSIMVASSAPRLPSHVRAGTTRGDRGKLPHAARSMPPASGPGTRPRGK